MSQLNPRFCNEKHSFKMVVTRFQRKIHMVHDHVSICHGDGLPELHVWVVRSTMGCPACLELTSQLSPPNDFIAGNSYDGRYDHMGRNELSTT